MLLPQAHCGLKSHVLCWTWMYWEHLLGAKWDRVHWKGHFMALCNTISIEFVWPRRELLIFALVTFPLSLVIVPLLYRWSLSLFTCFNDDLILDISKHWGISWLRCKLVRMIIYGIGTNTPTRSQCRAIQTAHVRILCGLICDRLRSLQILLRTILLFINGAFCFFEIVLAQKETILLLESLILNSRARAMATKFVFGLVWGTLKARCLTLTFLTFRCFCLFFFLLRNKDRVVG